MNLVQHVERQDTTGDSTGCQLELEEVQPLLAAYDTTIAHLQGKLQDRQDEVRRFEQRLEQISIENCGLLESLKTVMQEAAQNVRLCCIPVNG